MMYTLSKELEQELIVSAPELQPSYAAIVEYLEAINQKRSIWKQFSGTSESACYSAGTFRRFGTGLYPNKEEPTSLPRCR